MLVFYQLLPHVQQLLAREIGLNVDFLVLVAPESLLQSHRQLVLFYGLSLLEFVEILLVLLRHVFSLDHLGFLLDEEVNEG